MKGRIANDDERPVLPVEADVYFTLSQRIGLFNGVVGKLQPILSRVEKQFESATLAPPDDSDRARHEAVDKLNQYVDEAKSAAFDIDEVSEADVQPPDFPPSPLTPADVDAVLHRPDLLPPGVECRALEPSTYAVRFPGDRAAIRVTTSPEVFDEHFESHQLLLADSPSFRRCLDLASADGIMPSPETRLADLIAGNPSVRMTVAGEESRPV